MLRVSRDPIRILQSMEKLHTETDDNISGFIERRWIEKYLKEVTFFTSLGQGSFPPHVMRNLPHGLLNKIEDLLFYRLKRGNELYERRGYSDILEGLQLAEQIGQSTSDLSKSYLCI